MHAINANGQVVGNAYTGAGHDHAFLWRSGLGMLDLNSLIVPSSGWTLNSATAINVNGWIVGYGINPSGQDHAFLLTPLLKPSTLTWTYTGGGSWNNLSNWDGNQVPGTYPQDTATFGTVVGSTTATVTLDGSWTIGGLSFSTTGGGSYVISRSAGDSTSTLTLTGTGTSFPLTNSGGNHTIAVPVVLGSNLSVSTSTGSSLTVSAPVSEGQPGHERDRHWQRPVDPLRQQHVHRWHNHQWRNAAIGRRSEQQWLHCR